MCVQQELFSTSNKSFRENDLTTPKVACYWRGEFHLWLRFKLIIGFERDLKVLVLILWWNSRKINELNCCVVNTQFWSNETKTKSPLRIPSPPQWMRCRWSLCFELPSRLVDGCCWESWTPGLRFRWSGWHQRCLVPWHSNGNPRKQPHIQKIGFQRIN